MPDTGTATDISARSETALASRGIHHLALTTEDMQMTTDFFVNVVGMPLVHAMKVPPGVGTGPGNRGNPPYEEIRHYFFDMAMTACSPISKFRRAKKNYPTGTISGACSTALSR